MGRLWASFLAAIGAVWKFAYPIFKLAKGGKILLTAGSMLASVALYSMRYGWQFAVGFVLCIFAHEMGHVFFAWRQGVPVSTPVFIPGFGALILTRRGAKSAWGSALIGIGGPLFGTAAALICWGIYALTGNPLYLGLAFFGFFMNLFNMVPFYPLDGGWITGAISPYIWIGGLVMMAGLAFLGISNPFIWLLAILSIPKIFSSLKRGTADPVGGVATTSMQKVTMGFAYVGLCLFLVIGMALTYSGGSRQIRHLRRASHPIAQTVAKRLSG